LTIVIDFSNTSMLFMTGFTQVKTSLDVLHILLNHYPERLGDAFMIHEPWFFTMFWKVIHPLIDNQTASKIHFFSKHMERILEFISEDELEIEYGGKKYFPI